MFLVEELHKNDIAVILDWVPLHFPGDATGLYNFDGTHLYEHSTCGSDFIQIGSRTFLITTEMKYVHF